MTARIKGSRHQLRRVEQPAHRFVGHRLRRVDLLECGSHYEEDFYASWTLVIQRGRRRGTTQYTAYTSPNSEIHDRQRDSESRWHRAAAAEGSGR